MQGDRGPPQPPEGRRLRRIQSLIIRTGPEKSIGTNQYNLKSQHIQEESILLQKPIEERKSKLASNVEKKDTMLTSVQSEERSMSWI